MAARKISFSGIQPSGELHIGNYLGAVRNWVKMQDDYELYICVVDLHAITQPYEPSELQQHVFDMAMTLMAAGIDPDRSTLFVQSHVPEHTELAWIFTSLAPVGELERMTQYKDKTARQKSILAGLLNYPILQSADILLYRAKVVPVGEDQLQHLEFSRKIARKWNARYGVFFPEPEALIGKVKKVLGLDGQSKMSKSLGNTIGLLESSEAIWEKLRPAYTDPARKTRKDPGNPDICNIFSLHQHFSSEEDRAWAAEGCRTAGIGCIDCKRRLADNMIEALRPIRERAEELKASPQLVYDALERGAEHCRQVAAATMSQVRQRMGLRSAKGPDSERDAHA